MNNNPYTQKQSIGGDAKGNSSKPRDQMSLKGSNVLKKDSKLGHKSLSPRPIESPKDPKGVTTVI